MVLVESRTIEFKRNARMKTKKLSPHSQIAMEAEFISVWRMTGASVE